MSYHFKPSWLISIIFLILVASLICLGFWQLSRANEKQLLQSLVDERTALPPVSLNMPIEEFAPYQSVEATGRYLANDSILLDNIVYQGKAGYYLLTPFEILATRSVIMVNRGWLPQGKSRAELPIFKTPDEIITLQGHLIAPRSKPVFLGDSVSPMSETPSLWNFIDLEFFSQLQGYPLLPLVFNLQEGGQTSTITATPIPSDLEENSLIRDWPRYDANSGMHIGYSIQWFVFALFALIAYFGISFKKIKKEHE